LHVGAATLPHGGRVVVEVVVVDVVVVDPGVSPTIWSTKSSTASSIVLASPVTMQPPLFSAFVKAVLNFVSALERQSGSTLAFRISAFEWHLSFAATFLPVAFCLAAAHFASGVPPA
jgi:hypothetical protein